MLFFFASRRRHTRLQGDWSSDVCSSDLEDVGEIHRRAAASAAAAARAAAGAAELREVEAGERRSEERRVGKKERSPTRATLLLSYFACPSGSTINTYVRT